MSLLDDLRRIENFPPSHLPSVSEVLEVVGLVVAYVEHGDDLLKAAEQDAKAREAGEPATAVGELLSPPETAEPDATAPASPAAPLGTITSPAASSPVAPAAVPPAGAPDGGEDPRDVRIRELKAELAAGDEDPRDAEIKALEQQLATRRGVENRTQVTVSGDHPVEDEDPTPPPPGDASGPDRGQW